MARAPLTRRRLFGLDRSGPPPIATLRGQPLRPWTLPNAICFVRLALIPVFLGFAFSSGDGRSVAAATVYAIVGGSDYLDGIVARVTGQYSRLGALLDPLIDRLLVVSGVAVAFSFDLLPRWALVILAARELLMLLITELALRRGLDLDVTMVGRVAVWPTMFSLFLAMVSSGWAAPAMLLFGLVLTLVATGQYLRHGWLALRAAPSPGRPPSTSA